MKGNGRERQGKEEGSADAELGIREPRLCGSACRAAPRTVGAPPSSTVPPALSRSSSGVRGGGTGDPSIQPRSGCGAGAPGRCESHSRPHSPRSCSGKSLRARPHHNPPVTGVLVPP